MIPTDMDSWSIRGSGKAPASNNESSFKAGLKNVAAMVLGLGIALTLSELILALFIPPPQHYLYPQTPHQSDPQLGWIPRPNQSSYTVDQPVFTNSLGLRSGEVRIPKPSGVFRVLCLGDSQTFGNGVAQNQTYPSQLQRLLEEAAGDRETEVVNAGVQAYNTEQEVDLFERIGPELSPDVVTIGFYLNDIGEALRNNKSDKISEETGSFQRTGIVKQFIPYSLIYLLKRSRLVTLVYWRYRMLQAGGDTNPQHRILAGDTPSRYGESWNRIKQALVRAQTFSNARGFRLFVFPIPAAQEFRGDYPDEQYRSRFISLARDLGIPSFDPKPAMDEVPDPYKHFYVTWDGHINADGHSLIARLLAQEIVASGALHRVERGGKAQSR